MQGMSALGHKQTLFDVRAMSALPPKADMCAALMTYEQTFSGGASTA